MACIIDGWSSKYQKKSFNAITLHHINEIFELQTTHLGVHQVHGHDAQLTATGLRTKLEQFKLLNKVNFIAVDDASVMTSVVRN